LPETPCFKAFSLTSPRRSVKPHLPFQSLSYARINSPNNSLDGLAGTGVGIRASKSRPARAARRQKRASEALAGRWRLSGGRHGEAGGAARVWRLRWLNIIHLVVDSWQCGPPRRWAVAPSSSGGWRVHWLVASVKKAVSRRDPLRTNARSSPSTSLTANAGRSFRLPFRNSEMVVGLTSLMRDNSP